MTDPKNNVMYQETVNLLNRKFGGYQGYIAPKESRHPPPPPPPRKVEILSHNQPQESSPNSVSRVKDTIAKIERTSLTKTPEKTIKVLEFEVVNVKHIASRLVRRIHMWIHSVGYSIETNEDISTFVNSLSESNDDALLKLSEYEHELFLNWAMTMKVLRELEVGLIQNLCRDSNTTLVLNVTSSDNRLPSDGVEIEISSLDSVRDVAFKIHLQTNLSIEWLVDQVQQEVAQEKGESFYQLAIEILHQQLVSAEDMCMFQEETIERLVNERDDLLKKLEGTDKLITRTSSTIDHLEKFRNEKNMDSGKLKDTSSSNSNDKDVVERRAWIEEKHQLIKAHNDEKSLLIQELKQLRQTLNPNTEKVLTDLRKIEHRNASLEDELVHLQIERDNFQKEISKSREVIHQLENERKVVTKYYEDQIKDLEMRLNNSSNFQNISSNNQKEDSGVYESANKGSQSIVSKVKYPIIHVDNKRSIASLWNQKNSNDSSDFKSIHDIVEDPIAAYSENIPRFNVNSSTGIERPNESSLDSRSSVGTSSTLKSKGRILQQHVMTSDVRSILELDQQYSFSKSDNILRRSIRKELSRKSPSYKSSASSSYYSNGMKTAWTTDGPPTSKLSTMKVEKRRPPSRPGFKI